MSIFQTHRCASCGIRAQRSVQLSVQPLQLRLQLPRRPFQLIRVDDLQVLLRRVRRSG